MSLFLSLRELSTTDRPRFCGSCGSQIPEGSLVYLSDAYAHCVCEIVDPADSDCVLYTFCD
jgi:hypothetical protein